MLIAKEGYDGKPDQFRLITCLNTTYKLLTGVVTQLLMVHMTEVDALPREQKAMRRGRRGCLDALVVDSMVAQEAKGEKRNLSMGWVDYRKAFDLVPHESHRCPKAGKEAG